jgi:UDP-glucose 4-epimerase
MLNGEQPVINGDGKQTRDYVFVGDVVKANMLALSHDASAVFNVGTGIETDVNELFSHLRSLTQSQCHEHHGPAKKGEQQRSVIDSSCLRNAFGWKPSVLLQDGLKLTVEYFQQQR